MSINKEDELDARIQNFLERKLQRFPEIANLDAKQERSSLTAKARRNGAVWTV